MVVINKRNHKQNTGSAGVNYGPPSDAEKKETEQFKKDLEKKTTTQSSPSNSSSASKQANVTMSYANYESNQVSSAGFVNNVFEDGGVCTLTLSKGSTKITGTSTGLQDVNKTTCSPINIDRSKLGPGEWSAVLSYSSSSASGSSPARIVNVL